MHFKQYIGWCLSLSTAVVPPLRRKLLISSLFCLGPAVFAHGGDQLSANAGDL